MMDFNEDIDIILNNLPLLLQNKDKILNNKTYAQCKIKDCGIYFKNKHTYIGFTLGNLLKLWSSPCSSWKFSKYYTYKMTLFGNGEADIFSKAMDGSYETSLIDADIIVPLIEDAIRIGEMVLVPKNTRDIISELKKEDNV